jgi:hypothetical protein
MNIPDFQYKNNVFDSLKLNFLADGQDINYQLDLNRFSSNSFYFTDLIFSGHTEDSVLYNRIQKVDSAGNDLYFIGINLFKSQEGLEINLSEDKLVLNGHNWNTIKDSGLLVDTANQLNGKIGIMRGMEKIVAGVDNGSSFFLKMDNFDLGTFSELINYANDSLVLEGKVDLDASVQLSDSIPDIDADVSIAGLTYNQMHLGDIHMEVINSHEKKVSFRATLENEGNRIGLNGYYAQTDPSPLLIDLDIDISSLSAFETFAMGKLDQLEGQIRGEIQLAGDLKDFSVNGVLDLNKVGVFSRQLNNKYYIEKESLEFINKDLRLNEFTITDSLNNDFSINGTIGYLIPEKSPVNLQIRADKFTVYNAREKENPSLYGKMIISLDAKATGNLQDPKLSVKLAIEPETDMTVVRPPKAINLVTYEDIIEFSDPENPDTVFLSKDMDLALPDSIRSRFEGYEMVANLSIHERAAFRLVIDPNSGDYVSIKGKGDLNIQVKEGADPLLSGVYEVREGIYQVSFYGLVQKSFNILNGSTIIWAGDPMNARMNLIASHILRTSSTGLVAAETVGLSDEQLNQYRRALPYEVKILIAGTFRQPELNFEINLVDENRAAYPLVISKLSQINGEGYESLLTQQVFGLLTIGSFIPEQTFDSGSGNSGSALATTAAANSLNGILAGEFNKLSGKYLKGVNLDIGLQSYSQMSSGDASTQTAMDVKFSKNLFDDRVTIEAQTTFDVGGDNYTDPTGYDYSNFHSDFAIKYDLTPKGDYKLKAFNRSSFDIIYKDIWSTGIAIIFVKEFDKLSETRKNRKDKQKQEE